MGVTGCGGERMLKQIRSVTAGLPITSQTHTNTTYSCKTQKETNCTFAMSRFTFLLFVIKKRKTRKITK